MQRGSLHVLSFILRCPLRPLVAVTEVDNISNSSILSGIQYGPIYIKYNSIYTYASDITINLLIYVCFP